MRLHILIALILREMTTRYGRSAGGYVWAFLEPVAFILMFTAIFMQIARDPMLGTSFALFFATGVIAFTIYRDIADFTSSAVLFNKPLFTYPSVRALDAVMARFVLQFLTLLVVATVVFVAIFMIDDIVPNLDFEPLLFATLLAALTGLGVGVLNCTLFVFSQTWMRIFGVFNRPLFLISGVFFTPESLPAEIRDIVLLNPLVHIVSLMRMGFYPAYDAVHVNYPFMIAVPVLTITAGLILLWKLEGRLIEQ